MHCIGEMERFHPFRRLATRRARRIPGSPPAPTHIAPPYGPKSGRKQAQEKRNDLCGTLKAYKGPFSFYGAPYAVCQPCGRQVPQN